MLNDKTVLIDMDLTLVDFSPAYELELARTLPADVIANRDLNEYWIENQFEEQYHDAVHNILRKKGFFRNMQPIDGGVQAIREMVDEGINVIICSKPHHDSIYCIPEKKEWLEEFIGKEFADNALFPHDKTEVPGDILIDDRTDVISKGKHIPSWKQIVFEAEHNKNYPAKYRLKDWKYWRNAFDEILKSAE